MDLDEKRRILQLKAQNFNDWALFRGTILTREVVAGFTRITGHHGKLVEFESWVVDMKTSKVLLRVSFPFKTVKNMADYISLCIVKLYALENGIIGIGTNSLVSIQWINNGYVNSKGFWYLPEWIKLRMVQDSFKKYGLILFEMPESHVGKYPIDSDIKVVSCFDLPMLDRFIHPEKVLEV